MDAQVRPNRSLPNPGFIALMIAMGVISFPPASRSWPWAPGR